MADEEEKVEDKVKTAVSSLGEGCSTLVAVYIGAIIVALVITYFQRRDPSQATRTQTSASQQERAVVIQEPSPSVDSSASPQSSAPSVTPFPPATTVPIPNPDALTTTGTGVLITQDAASSVNVRESPTTAAEIVHAGYAGDQVNILGQSTDEQGSIWYRVEFLNGGGTGWVHGDYLQLTRPNASPYEPPEITVPTSQPPIPPAVDS